MSSDIMDNGDNAFIYPYPVSENLKKLIRWMMQPKRSERPQAACEVENYLSKCFYSPSEETQYTKGYSTQLENTIYNKPTDSVTPNSRASVYHKPETSAKIANEETTFAKSSISSSHMRQLSRDSNKSNIIQSLSLLALALIIAGFSAWVGWPKKNTRTQSEILQDLINNMVFVEGGTYMMGATSEQGDDAWDDEKPVHQVTLSSFSIGMYEVSQEEWQTVMGNNPSEFRGTKKPVENVSWEDCQVFIQKLNTLTGKKFRLPTEAEWEFAARGGNKSKNFKYAGSNNYGSVAWYRNSSGKTTHDVGQKQPNELGLYDMSGNVREWVHDYYENYVDSSLTNPTGTDSGYYHVVRGGGCTGFLRDCRSSRSW